MKYFTQNWWASGCADEAVFTAYQNYYCSISSTLPPALRSLLDEHTLHDSNVMEIDSDFLSKTVTIQLNGWDTKFEKRLTYRLSFRGVTRLVQTLPRLECDSYGADDLGYYEVEVVEKLIEFRALFASDAELKILFTDFAFTATANET